MQYAIILPSLIFLTTCTCTCKCTTILASIVLRPLYVVPAYQCCTLINLGMGPENEAI